MARMLLAGMLVKICALLADRGSDTPVTLAGRDEPNPTAGAL